MESAKSSRKLFYKVLIAHSQTHDTNNVFDEWDVEDVKLEKNNCICGHFIVENIIIKNKINKNKLIVGNVCVKLFANDDFKTRNEKELKKIDFVIKNHKKILKHGMHNGREYKYIFLTHRSYCDFLNNNIITNNELCKFKKYVRQMNSLINSYEEYKKYNDNRDYIKKSRKEKITDKKRILIL